MLSLLSNDLLQTILAILSVVGVFFGYGVAKKRQGRKQATEEFEHDDRENAKAIRNRVDRAKSDGLRPDSLKFRD